MFLLNNGNFIFDFYRDHPWVIRGERVVSVSSYFVVFWMSDSLGCWDDRDGGWR